MVKKRQRTDYQSELQLNAIFVKRNQQTQQIGMSKNFGLNQQDFDGLVHELQSGNQTLFEAIFLKHFKDCMHYLINNFGTQQPDAYDLTMDTLLEFRQRLIDGKVEYGNLQFLFTRMAVQKYWRWAGKQKKQQNPMPSSTTETMYVSQEEEEPISESEINLLNKALEKISTECRQLLQSFYVHRVKLRELAIETDRKPEAVRKQKQRCINRLRQLFLQYSKQYVKR